MSVTASIIEAETGLWFVDVEITCEYLEAEANDYIKYLAETGSDTCGLYARDLTTSMLKRRRDKLIKEAKRLGFKHTKPFITLKSEVPSESNCIGFGFRTKAEAVAFRLILL